MPSPTKGPRLGGSPAHERLMLANLATALFEHGRITTTEAKAKRLRPLAERLITFAKRGDLAARRRVMTVIRDKDVVHVLFTEIAPDVRQPCRVATPGSPRSVRARATTPPWRSSSWSSVSTRASARPAPRSRRRRLRPHLLAAEETPVDRGDRADEAAEADSETSPTRPRSTRSTSPSRCSR